jgi:geranylgeranyl diphosphate synthase type I
MRRVAAYHMGWIDADGQPADAGGKALRPALALLSARAAGEPATTGLPGAVATELVHAFSLLHDDIMDGDRMRRHRPAAWTVFGTSATILAGDALLALAEDLLLEAGSRGGFWAARCLTAAAQRLIAGQALDLGFEERDDVTLAECVSMAGDKTGALIACACSIGAMLADAPAPLVTGLAAFGSEVGLAFQLVDDLLGIWGSPEVTGKPVLSDLRARKKSLPVVAALTAEHGAAPELHALLTRPEELTEDDLVRAASLVEEAGGRAWAEAEANSRMEAAARHLEGTGIPTDVRDELLDIAAFVTFRDN